MKQSSGDYIDDHWDEEITLADWPMFRIIPLVFLPLVCETLNMTPSTYIRRLRLSKSALKLRDDQVKIVDVVFESVITA